MTDSERRKAFRRIGWARFAHSRVSFEHSLARGLILGFSATVLLAACSLFDSGGRRNALAQPESQRNLRDEVSAVRVPSKQGIEWETYRNEKYGYEVEYPKDWGTLEAVPRVGEGVVYQGNILDDQELQKITFLEKTYTLWQGEFQIRVLANPENLSLEQWAGNYRVEDVGGGDLVKSKSKTMLAGKPAMKLSIFGFDHEEIAVVTLRGDYIYYLAFAGTNPNDPNLVEHQRIYEMILDSFSFLELD